jgi:hypothetical protein
MVMNGRDCAGKPNIACMKMLVAMDGQRTLFGNAGADAIGAFNRFTPDGTGPKTPIIKCIVITRSTATLDWYAFTVGQKHATTNPPNRHIEAIHAGLCNANHPFHTLAGGSQFMIRERLNRACFCWVEPIKTCRAAP